MTGENSMGEKSRIRAVFSDVDGTLLNSAHRVTPRTAEWIRTEWIRKLGEMDIPFVIVSARSPSGIYPIMKRNGFQSALIAYSGALIMDKDRNILYNRQIPRDLAAGIERFFIEKKRSDIRFDMSWCIYSADDWISPDRNDPRIVREGQIVEAQSREGTVEDLASGAGVNKFLCICAPGTILEIEKEVKKNFPEVEAASLRSWLKAFRRQTRLSGTARIWGSRRRRRSHSGTITTTSGCSKQRA